MNEKIDISLKKYKRNKTGIIHKMPYGTGNTEAKQQALKDINDECLITGGKNYVYVEGALLKFIKEKDD